MREDLVFYWEAYLDLTKDRAFGFGQGPIPWRAINEWAIRFEIRDPEDFQLLKELIWKIDLAYLEHCEKTRRKK